MVRNHFVWDPWVIQLCIPVIPYAYTLRISVLTGSNKYLRFLSHTSMYSCSNWIIQVCICALPELYTNIKYKPALPGSFKYRYLLFLGHSSMYSYYSLVIQVCIEAQSYIYVFALRHTSSMYICSYCITHSYICSTWIAQTNFHSKVMQVYIPALTNICFSWVIQVYNTCSSWFIQHVRGLVKNNWALPYNI